LFCSPKPRRSGYLLADRFANVGPVLSQINIAASTGVVESEAHVGIMHSGNKETTTSLEPDLEFSS
jgi:hypothetical protein